MLSYSRLLPDKREWYALWEIRLLDNPQISIGTLSFKGLSSDGTTEIGYGIYPDGFSGIPYFRGDTVPLGRHIYLII